jgi:hypothetical protein
MAALALSACDYNPRAAQADLRRRLPRRILQRAMISISM